MAWDEWEQLKAEAAKKHAAHTELNQVMNTGGGGGSVSDADLVVHDDELGKLGHMAYELHGRLQKDGHHASASTHGAAAELSDDGLDTGKALSEVHDAWNTQVGTLLEACARISNHLDFSRAQHAKDDAKIATGMRDAAGHLMTVSRISDYIQ
jgi:hypothetical protein